MTDLPKIDWLTAEGDPSFAYTLCPNEHVNAFSFQVQRGYHDGKRTTDAQRAEITRRLIASWNFCADEDLSLLELMAQDGTTLRAHRNDLLSLCETYQRQIDSTEKRLTDLLAAVDRLNQSESATVGNLVKDIRDAAAKARRPT